MTDATLEQATTGAENVIWDLSALYNGVDDPAIDVDMESLTATVSAFAKKYRGRVAELDAAEMVQAVRKMEAIQDSLGKLGSFPSLLYSTDTADPRHGALVQKTSEFGAKISQQLVFFDLEWNALPEDHVDNLLSADELAFCRHYLEAQRRYKPYQLTEAEERIMLDKSVTGRQAWTRFFTQLTSAMRFEIDGEELNQTKVLTRLHDVDRETRRKAAEALTIGLRKKEMELAYIFNVIAADKASDDTRRGYETWVTSRNVSNKAPEAVVNALVETVTSNYDLVARHYEIKRAILGYDALYDYDRYAPLPAKSSDKRYTWDEAKEIVLGAFHAFSPQVADAAERFFDEQWIHAPVLPNKRGGAYAHPTVPSAHPFVFVNFNGTANDVMTLAHELGHGIHMALSGEEHGLFGLYTPLTTAEMASTFAEMLVFTDLMEREPDPEARLAMLSSKIEDTFATVFRQVSMNRFEDALHTARRTEGELTHARISELWMDTQKAMFGDSVTLQDDYGAWWSYVPHFLMTPGYVYAYAFGELLVLALFELYKERGADFVPQYVEVLKAGDSDYPDRILDKVGVDLNDPAFWQKGIDVVKALIDQEADLAKEVYPDKMG